jgi:group I intron endonuclease
MEKIIKGIYCIRNLKTNKVYIGQSNDVLRRRAEHFYELNRNNHHNRYLQNAWNKCAPEDFIFTIIEKNVSLKELSKREGYWINEYKSLNKNFGYNLQIIDVNGNYKINEETKLKLSKQSYFRHHPNATEDDFNRYIYLKANPIPKINLEPGEVQRRPIIQIDKTTGLFVREFRSLAEASKEMGCPNYKKIQDSARGDIKSYRGYVYVYKDQYDENKDYIVRRPTKYKNSKSM